MLRGKLSLVGGSSPVNIFASHRISQRSLNCQSCCSAKQQQQQIILSWFWKDLFLQEGHYHFPTLLPISPALSRLTPRPAKHLPLDLWWHKVSPAGSDQWSIISSILVSQWPTRCHSWEAHKQDLRETALSPPAVPSRKNTAIAASSHWKPYSSWICPILFL